MPPLTTNPSGNAASRAPGRSLANWFALALCLAFFLQGLVLIPYLGVQNDEALFGMAIYQPLTAEYSAQVLGHSVPTMIMSYIGALKAWIYFPMFQIWPPSPYSLRIPVLLFGTLTVWLFFLLVRDTVGARAALAGCALLAFDPIFLLTNTFDWGPVALQHLLLVAGVWLVARFYQRGGMIDLGAGFFLLGLGLWDKALFVWMLSGLGVATLVVFRRELASRLTRRNASMAVVFFLAGVWPLVAYNRERPMQTLRANANFSTSQLDSKLIQMKVTLEGGSLLGYLVRDEPAPRPGRPASLLERWSVALSEAADERRAGYMVIACVLALALLPWLWTTPARRPMLFSLVLMLVAWAQMLFTKDAGGSAHHTVLLWPFPHLLVVAAFAQATGVLRRAGPVALAALVAVVCGSNLLVTNQYLAQAVVRGPGAVWTDAINPLAEYLKSVPAQRVYVMDWGIFDAIRLLDQGQVALRVGSDQVSKEKMDDSDRQLVREMLAAPETVFVGHTEGNEVFSGSSARLVAAAEAAGYRKQVLRVVGDGRGRPMFEVYRWTLQGRSQPISAPAQPSGQ